MNTADHLKTIRERVENATEGPWEAVTGTFDSEVGKYEGAHIPGVAEVVSDYYIGEVPPFESADAEFIAHARTDLPRLLDALERVLELHKPNDANLCGVCAEAEDAAYALPYPCPTHTAINDALEGK